MGKYKLFGLTADIRWGGAGTTSQLGERGVGTMIGGEGSAINICICVTNQSGQFTNFIMLYFIL